MSIYIRGMKMPSNGYVDVRLFADGWAHIPSDEPPYNKAFEAIELPEHGRLIDADALMDGWMNLREATKYGNKTAEQQSHSYSTMMMYEIAYEIEDAPTIIPASGGDGE